MSSKGILFGVFRTSRACYTVSWLGEAEKMLSCSPAFTRQVSILWDERGSRQYNVYKVVGSLSIRKDCF